LFWLPYMAFSDLNFVTLFKGAGYL
jgi:hypothetical protein